MLQYDKPVCGLGLCGAWLLEATSTVAFTGVSGRDDPHKPNKTKPGHAMYCSCTPLRHSTVLEKAFVAVKIAYHL